MKNELPEKLRPYDFHGIGFSGSGNIRKADCPFCDKEGHFYVNVGTGQFSCKRCLEEGNTFTFLQKVFDYSMKNTSDKALLTMSKDRGIPISEFKEWGLCKSCINDEWLLPGYNTKNALANLYKIVKQEGKWKAYSTPGCNMHPFGTKLLNKSQKILWTCEGPWDGMKLRFALKNLRSKTSSHDPEAQLHKLVDFSPKKDKEHKPLLDLHGVMSVPGAGNFAPGWVDYMEGRQVRLVFDNDHPKKNPKTGLISKPGSDGQKRVVKLVGESGRFVDSIYKIMWGKAGYDKSLPTGYDVRDMLNDHGDLVGLQSLMERLILTKDQSALVSEDEIVEVLDPLPRKNFGQLCQDWHKSLHFTQPMCDTLAVTLAAVISTTLKGEQLFLRVIGPPGSGKSTIAEAITAAREYVFAKSILTGFHSGYTATKKQGDGKKRRDPSLVPMIQNKMVIMKDADTLTSAPNKDKILSELRDIYDGASRTQYRTGEGKDYENIRCSFLLCGTDELRLLNKSFLGDRFLDCEIMADGSNNKPYLDSAVANAYELFASSVQPSEGGSEAWGANQLLLKRATIGFINHLKASLGSITPPTFPKEAQEKIKGIGQLLAYMRARVHREGKDLLYRPRAELATRLSAQFTKLAGCLAIVLGRRSIDKEVMRIVQKVSNDTAVGFQSEITQYLASNKRGLSSHQLAIELQLSESTVRRWLKDMQELGIARSAEKSNNSGIRGRNLHLWELTSEVRSLWEKAHK